MLAQSAEDRLLPSSAEFIDLISSIGDSSFAVNILSLAHRMCGADHSSVFHWRCGGAAVVVSLAPASFDGSDAAHRLARRYVEQNSLRYDPAFVQSSHDTSHRPLFFHTDLIPSNIPCFGNLYKAAKIGDRALVCQRSEDDVIGVSLLREAENGKFSEGEIWRLQNLLEPLLALSRKHLDVLGSAPNLAGGLNSLQAIEQCLDNGPIAFPRREAQVCSRIIYGVTTAGIACELGVAEETVSTYRKRIYDRLGIATQRELLLWYLSTWGVWGRQCQGRLSIH